MKLSSKSKYNPRRKNKTQPKIVTFFEKMHELFMFYRLTLIADLCLFKRVIVSVLQIHA